MSRDDGGSAFPHDMQWVGAGMTLRDYFAAQVVNGFRFTTMLGMPEYTDRERQRSIELGAKFAYELADALLLERTR